MEVSSVKIDLPTLQLIVNAITKLQILNGLADDDTIWSFADAKMELTNLPETRELFRPALPNVMDLLKQLEAVGDALKELTASCERKLKALKMTLQPSFLRCGIQMLPDDVLMHIFDMIMEQPDRTSEEVVRLSHVSSRFRSLTLARPRLWSRVAPDMPPNIVKICLEHSKQSLLTVLMVDMSAHRYFQARAANKFLGLVIPHSSRWKAFGFSCTLLLSDTERSLQLARSMGDCNVWNLEVLDLDYCSREGCGLCKAMDVLQTQEMPKLRSLRFKCISSSPTWLSRPLPSVHIRCLELAMSAECDIRTLVNVLAPLVDLVELKLSAFRSPLSHIMNDPSTQDTGIGLPKLVRLHLLGFDLVSFSVWTRCCHTPRVEELELLVKGKHVEEWLTAIPSGSFGSVKKLYFRHWKHAGIVPLNGDVVDFWHLASKFPGLEHLDLQAQSCSFDSDLRHELSTTMPPLCSLSLDLTFPVTGLHYFVDTLKDSGRWEQFKSYEMRWSGRDTKEEAERLLAGKEVK